MTEAITITPRLLMGPPEAACAWPDVLPVESANDALTAMRSGLVALLQPGRWDMAAEVLRMCGAPEDWVLFTVERAGGSL